MRPPFEALETAKGDGIGESVRMDFQLRKDKVVYNELGSDFLDKLNAERLKRHLTKPLESLGCKVEISKGETAAEWIFVAVNATC
jgi:hypothetical protein